MRIHVWCGGVYEQRGGIEAYSGALVQALLMMGWSNRVRVLAKHDRAATLRKNLPSGSRGSGTGHIPLGVRTPAFAALLLTAAVIERPNLIISTHPNFGPLARRLKSGLGIPYWISLHGVDAWNLTHPGRAGALKEADLLLPVSSFTRDRVAREQNIPLKKFRVLPNSIDPTAWRITPKPRKLLERYNLSPGTAVILTVGRLSAAEGYKGQDRIIRVLKEVADRLRNAVGEVRGVKYLIVGDGNDWPRLERLSEEAGVRELVIFTGKVPAAELNDHYNLCDLFAMPSTGEGFGIVFLEALACGKPVLGGNKDAASDALRNGELGVLIDPDDRIELRETIVSILLKRHPHSMIFQPKLLREKAIEYFGYEKFKATLAVYLEEFTAKR